MLQRQDILARYPAYERLSQQAQAIRQTLGKLPLVADDPAAAKQQSRQLAELAAIGLAARGDSAGDCPAARAGRAWSFRRCAPSTTSRNPCPTNRPRSVFFATSRHWYGFLLNNDRVTHWRINSPQAVLRQMQTMLRDMGLYGQNHELAIKDLTGAKWKQSAGQVLNMLEKGSLVDLSQPFDELVIVPDGVLWYLPFEALQVKVDGQPQSLISRFRIRYAPTFSLCTGQGPGRNPAGNTAVVLGKLYPRDDDAVAQAAFEQLAAVVPGAVALRSPPPASSSVYSTLFQRLIVLDDLALSDRDPYGWAPASIDRGKAGGLLSDWLLLPWGGPDVVILPGFHTAAEDAHEARRPQSARQRRVPLRLRTDGQRRADGAVEPLALRRSDELRPGAGVRPRTLRHHAGRRLATGGHAGGRFAAEPRGRAAHQARGQRGNAQGEQSVFLGRLHARRLRRGV